jgi:SAM-dependent methyltransferase
MTSRATRRLAATLGIILLGLVGGGCASAAREDAAPVAARQPDVIWVPSDLLVVNEMLTLAGVGADDVVYDLGCGDGRIVIEAARRFGARGVGVDIDPKLVREARRNAERAGVADRVTILEQDLFTTALADATVVMLYLSPAINLRLRPKLLRELRPGARIVSHEHDLGDWRPAKTIVVSLPERNHYVFLWRVPQVPRPQRPQ